MDVLIVNASKPVTAALRGLLRAERERRIATAASTTEAAACISRDRPAAAILDTAIPGGSVLDVLAHAKRVSPQTVMIVLAGSADESTRAACLEAGADHVFDRNSEFQEAVRVAAASVSAVAAT